MPNYYPVIPNDGLIGYMDVLVWSLRNGNHNCMIHWYVNDYFPDENTVLASFTEFAGWNYSPIPTGSPTNTGVDVTRRDVWIFPETIFQASGIGGPTVAYGYWVDFLDPLTGGTRILQAQRFRNGIAIYAVGQQIKFRLSWGGKQC